MYTMSIKNAYLNEVYQDLAKRNAEQKEFLQAVEEVLESLEPVVAAHPEYEKASLTPIRPWAWVRPPCT